jgi:ribonuclease P protein component
VKTGFSFPKKEKLKKKDEIREVFNHRRAVSCAGAKLFRRPNGLSCSRIAFTFSRKFGNSVDRNYSRRLSREVYRLLRNELHTGYDLVLLVYPGQDTFSVRMNQMRDLFTRAGLFDPQSANADSKSFPKRAVDPLRSQESP